MCEGEGIGVVVDVSVLTFFEELLVENFDGE